MPVSDETNCDPACERALIHEGLGSHQAIMTLIKGGLAHSQALLQAVTVKQLNQVDPIESAAVLKVLGAG